MRGLIMKDMLTIAKQAKAFLILILFFAVIPSFSGSSFAMLYAAMMPISALAYDENCKWDQLAAMMPYSVRDIVLSKYLLGYMPAGDGGAVGSLAVCYRRRKGNGRIGRGPCTDRGNGLLCVDIFSGEPALHVPSGR